MVERLETDVILAYDFCDANIDAVFPRPWIAELTDSAAISTAKDLPTRSPHLAPIQTDQDFIAAEGRASGNIFVNKTAVLQPQSHSWAPISKPQTGLVQVKLYQKLYETRQCIASHGIAHIHPRQETI